LDRIIVRASGSDNESVDVKSLQLWWDKNADGIADTGDTLLASGSYNTDDSSEQLAGGGLVLKQFIPTHILVTYDFNEYLFRGKNYAFTLEAKGVFAKTQDTQEELNPTAPNNYPLYSRKLTVAPDDFSAVEFFITRFYQLCLSRSPDQSGLDGWVNALVDGTQTGSDVAYGFVFSNEFLNKVMTNEEYLQILYKAFFNRQPDTAGMQGWLDAIANGATKEDVLNGFIYATEFANLCDEYGIKAYEGHITKAQKEAVEAFVTRFYQLCLDRDPDAAGLEGWTNNLLNQIQTGADVANGFIYSQEFIDKNTTNDEYLTILYRAFFNRDPDQAGWGVWLSELNAGKDRSDVLNGFLGSQEFINLCEDYGIVPF
jgi:hypothetical protein